VNTIHTILTVDRYVMFFVDMLANLRTLDSLSVLPSKRSLPQKYTNYTAVLYALPYIP